MVMKRVYILKQKLSFSWMSNQLPIESLQKFTDWNIEIKLKGDKPVLIKSGNIYRDIARTLPAADDVISEEYAKMNNYRGNIVEDIGNRFASYTSTVDSFRKIRMPLFFFIYIFLFNKLQKKWGNISAETLRYIVTWDTMDTQDQISYNFIEINIQYGFASKCMYINTYIF